MAERRTRKSTTTKPENTQDNTTTTEESAVTETVTPEAVETAPASENTETATEPKAEAPIDLTAFNAAVAEAVAEADETTGELPEAAMAKVTAAYRELDGVKPKNAAKKSVNEAMKDAMGAGNLPLARAYLNLNDKALVAAPSAAKPRERTPVDPTDAAVQRVATLQLARDWVVVPDGLADDFDERVERAVSENADAVKSYLDWLQADSESRGDEPEVASMVKAAAKLALGKAARVGGSTRATVAYTGERRDVAKHMVNAFADKEEGTFMSIAEIRAVKSDEYGDDAPSAGAVSARLFPKNSKGEDVPSKMPKLGIHPAEQDGKKGAIKGKPVED